MVAATSTLDISIPRFSQRENDQQVDHRDTRGAPYSDMDLLGHTKDYLETKDYPKLKNELNQAFWVHGSGW